MMGTNSTGCTEWERDFDPATEKPYPTESEWSGFLKSHQEQVANLLSEIDRLNVELARAQMECVRNHRIDCPGGDSNECCLNDDT